jgi:hypothetical protein
MDEGRRISRGSPRSSRKTDQPNTGLLTRIGFFSSGDDDVNIVDLISGQLSGDVLGKLGGLIGADESQTRSATSAAVPALLQVFGKMASSQGGADQLARAMGGLDTSMLGNLAGMLGGGQASGLEKIGGSLLGSLLGGGSSGGTASLLTSLLGTFLKMNPGTMKSLLTYLAPVVLGMVAKQFTGRPDAAGVSRLFSEQASNISRAVPSGLSLDSVMSAMSAVGGGSNVQPARHGETARQGGPARQGGHGHEPAPSGLPGWLIPLLLLGALGAGLYLWRGREAQKPAPDVREPVAVMREETIERRGDEIVDRTAVVERAANEVKAVVTEEVFKLPENLGDAGDVVKGLAGMFGDMTKAFEGVKDEESARAALPTFEAFAPQVEALQKQATELPEASRSIVAGFVGTGLKTLGPIVEKVMALPGVKELLGPVVTPMVETLAKLAG